MTQRNSTQTVASKSSFFLLNISGLIDLWQSISDCPIHQGHHINRQEAVEIIRPDLNQEHCRHLVQPRTDQQLHQHAGARRRDAVKQDHRNQRAH